MLSTITVKDNQAPFTAHVSLVDAAGNPVNPEDVPVWTSSNETVAMVSSTTADGLHATIKIPGGLGQAAILCSTTNHDGTKIVVEGLVIVEASGEPARGEIGFDLTGGANSTAATPTTVVGPLPAPAPVDETTETAADEAAETAPDGDEAAAAPAPAAPTA